MGRPDQAWLEDFLAKEKEVNGVKNEPEEAGAEGEAAKAEGAEKPTAGACSFLQPQ